MDILSFLTGVVVVLTVIVIVVLGLLITLVTSFSNLRGSLNGFVANTAEKLFKIEQLAMSNLQAAETFVDALENAMEGDKLGPHPGHPAQQVFRTADNKHVAHSLDEFIKKLEADPEYKDLADKIKADLENAIGDFNEYDDDDEDDDKPF